MSTNHHDPDHDPVWDLLDRAQPPEASPLFSRNVLREIRLDAHQDRPWWKRLLASKPLVASSLAAAAAVALLVSINNTASPDGPGIASNPPVETTPLAELHDELDQELLIAASEDPSLFSDEQLLAILY